MATSLQVVLDFEWTADNRRPVKPISEITQFPSVLVRLEGHKTLVVDEFNTYVRPTLNKVLPEFSTQLTGITQEMVDRSPTLQEALPQYMSWLKSHRLVGEAGERIGSWAFLYMVWCRHCRAASTWVSLQEDWNSFLLWSVPWLHVGNSSHKFWSTLLPSKMVCCSVICVFFVALTFILW